MYLCYVDESGTSDIPGTTTHFVLAGLSIPIWRWREADRDISAVMTRYDLENAELHTGWLLRKILEQSRIPDFRLLNYKQRRSAVTRHRTTHLLSLQKQQKHNTYRQTKKNYQHTKDYVHLTLAERQTLVVEIAQKVSKWGFARLFAECIDKTYFDPVRWNRSVDEQAFEQVVSRFEQYLQVTDTTQGQRNYGLIVHDNNQTISLKHTSLMREFHKKGTLWTKIERIIETPLFVESSLTRLVQIADLCCYAIRRYLENNEEELFRHVFERADRTANQTVVGVRHFFQPQPVAASFVKSIRPTLCHLHSNSSR